MYDNYINFIVLFTEVNSPLYLTNEGNLFNVIMFYMFSFTHEV